jgi:hypothetical protein
VSENEATDVARTYSETVNFTGVVRPSNRIWYVCGSLVVLSILSWACGNRVWYTQERVFYIEKRLLYTSFNSANGGSL